MEECIMIISREQREKLINALYKALIKEVYRAISGSSYHIRITARDYARENERSINQNLRNGGYNYQIKIPEDYFNLTTEPSVIYLIIIPL
jgi:hypothetical protein